MNKIRFASVLLFCALTAQADSSWTTAQVPADGVYKFTFGVDSVAEGFAVPASAVYDVQGTGYYTGETPIFSYGFLGTTDTSYQTDIPVSPSCSEPSAIDGFQVVQGQKIILHDATDANSVTCVKGPLASEYLPANASQYEGRYPIRFSMRGEERAYYAVTCTVVNVSSTTNADVTVFSERQHIITHHLSLAPGETKTFAWSVELAPNVYKTQGTYYDNAVNISVVGENAALASVTIVKQPQTSGTVRGEAVDNMNVGKTIWLCTDSTGTDQKNATPFFSLQNYSGVGSGLSRWAPANISIRNQGEGGLATNANTHRKSCLLKPGDYLYVEYGHNESGLTSYTNNLETYLQDVNEAGAYLLIVSPVERRSSWNSDTSTWNRSLGGYAEVGEAWVEDKIAQGARNVAFIDLNKRYNDWMNTELQRIHEVNPEISLNAAINFYYKSSKGANVDNTHINNAGTDQAAYWVWYDALARVAAGENAEEGSAAKVQADVLKGITEGYQGKIGVGGTVDNLPWSVTDDIINDGLAPNGFWDTPVSTGYAYANEACVASVAAWTNADNTVTISNVTMRILNPDNYYKAVIDIINADGATTNRYWSYYNYDIGGAGKVSGDLVDPNQPGFLNADKDKAAVTAADIETLTIPAGGKALVWIAKASATTWQTEDNGPCSPKYPVEYWSEVLLEDDCSDASTWTILSQAVVSTNVVEDALYFTTTGANSDNTKKNFGYYPPKFASAMGAGRYRITFKVKSDSGTVNFQLGDSINNTTTLFNNSKTLMSVTGTRVTGYGSTEPQITVVTEEDTEGEVTTTTQNLVNKLRWMDVDIILDRDNDRAYVSVGGSDYAEYRNAAFLPGSYSDRTWNFFGITCPGQQSSYGYVDDVKVVKLASVEYPTVTAAATPSDSALGSVTINGYETDSLTIYSGNDFIIKAASLDPDMYAFECWKDAGGNTVSTSPSLFIENATENIDYTAQFREYAREENREITWDFSAYQGDFEGVPTEHTVIIDNGMEFHLESGDIISGNGIYWHNSALGHKTGTETLSASGDHYIVYTPTASGTLTLKFSVDNYASNRKPHVTIKAADSASECQNASGDKYVQVKAANTEYTLTADLVAGTTYYIWTYSYNWGGGGYTHNYTIPSITYTYAPTYYMVSVSSSGNGSASASASEVLGGKSVTFTAKPFSAAYKFVNWTDGETAVSTDAIYTTTITANTTLVANFAELAKVESYAATYGFDRYDEADYSASTIVSNGSFAVQMVSGDSMTENGAVWYKAAVDDKSALGTSLSETGDHYIKFTAPYDGTVSFAASIDSLSDKYSLQLFIKAAETASECAKSGDAYVNMTSVGTVYNLSLAVTAGSTYFVWPYSWNSGAGGYSPHITISSITYTHASDPVTLTLVATEGGSVAINGVSGAGDYKVQKGEYVELTATPNIYYGLSSWTDNSASLLATTETFWCYVDGKKTVTANFLSESAIDITSSCDFAPFVGDDAITNMTAAWSQLVGRMEVHGAAGDALTENGIYWAGPKETSSSATSANSVNRYIKFVCVKSGTLSLTFNSDGKNGSNYGRIYVTDGTDNGTACMYKTNGDANGANPKQKTASAANTDTIGEFMVESGKTYYIWPYMYNLNTAKFWVTSISYAAVKSDYSPVTIVGSDGSSVTNLYYGTTIALNAPATSGTRVFTGWMAGQTELSSTTHLLYTATAEATLTATYRDADAHSFVWNPAIASGNWNDAANWLYEGLVPATTYPSDASQDVVTFDSAVTVTLPSAASASNVWFNADATLTGGNGITLRQAAGAGAITLNNSGFSSVSGKSLVISNDLWIVGTATNWVNQYEVSAEIRGGLKGTGTIRLYNGDNNYHGAKLYGDNRDFAGEVIFSGASGRRYQLWNSGSTTSSNAFWTVEAGAPTSVKNSDGDMVSAVGTYYFGGYSGTWWKQNYAYNYTLEIGALNRESNIDIYTGVDGRNPNITKVGSANLTLGTTKIKNLTVNGGSVTMPIGIAPSTLTIAEGTELRLAGDAAWEAGTTTNLFKYTTLAGNSAGELARQVKVTGLASGCGAEISVEDNVVKATIVAMPTTDDNEATITKDGDNYKVEVQAETVVLTVPDGVTVSEVVVSTNTTTVTGLPTGESAPTMKIAVSWTDGEGAHSENYQIVKIVDNAVLLDATKSVAVGNEEIPVTPAFADAGDETEPLAVTGSDVAVGVKAIPGLVYRLSRGTSPSGVDTAPANAIKTEKATSSRVSLADPTPPTGAAFYIITVDVK